MNFNDAPRVKREENVIPMINVVFLLLIFFLMTAQIAPPEPFEVDPPAASSQEPSDGPFTLYVSPEGEVGYQDLLGDEEAIDALVIEYTRACADVGCFAREDRPVVILRADAQAPARRIPQILGLLAGHEITNVQLATRESFGDAEE